MNDSNKLLSDLVAHRSYARYIPHLTRRESLEETVNRNMVMHLDRFPKLSRDITKAFSYVHELEVLPSMRALQFGGDAIVKNNLRSFNCSYKAIDDVRTFSEALFVLLSGTGFGYSVQKRHVNRLPRVVAPREEGIFFVHDSIQGWAQALQVLMEAYFYGSIRPVFNFGNVRPQGAPLKTSGARAPGPKPLEEMLITVEAKLKNAVGRQFTPLEVHDIICIISDCVLAGGIRRSALISLFDRDDQEMLKCKHGEWWVKHPYRARSNNSAVLPRSDVTQEEFEAIYKACKDSGAGEPGFIWTNDPDNYGTNPCAEIGLQSGQLCNLSTVNQTGIKDKRDFLKRVYQATLLGTLQAAYTDFPYLRPLWKQITDKEALLGVSFTGIADANNYITSEWLEEGAALVLEVNEKYAKKIGINLAARATAIKPEGTASCIFGSSSGIHARHAPHYLRRFRINNMDPLAAYLKEAIPDLVEDDILSPASTMVVTIPQESPPNAIIRDNESAIQLFNRAIQYNKYWVAPGHRYGANKHNVSCSLSVKDAEWDSLCGVMWKNRNFYTGVSLFPYDGGIYKQAPFEEITKERYEEISKLVKSIDFKNVKEMTDTTNRMEMLACSGAAGCEVK